MKSLLVLLLSIGTLNAEPFGELLARAKAGDAIAQYRTALCFAFGPVPEESAKRLDIETGIPPKEAPAKNVSEAVRYMALAANQKYPPAQCWHGEWLLNGSGPIRPNPNVGYTLIANSANQGFADAMDRLRRYYSSDGKNKEPVECLKWAILAERYGHKRAEPKLTILAETLTPATVREAWMRAEGFTPKKAFAGEYEVQRKRGTSLDDMLELAARVEKLPK